MRDKLTQLFDIRNVIGALLGIYGVVLTIAGFAPALLRERDKGAGNNPVDLYFGTEANWWVGLSLIAVAVVFFAWALMRPVKAEVTADARSETGTADARSTTGTADAATERETTDPA